MKKNGLNIVALFVVACFSVAARAEEQPSQNFIEGIKIPIDAEYNGILIDASKEVSIYYEGQLKSGFLKNDTAIEGVTYKAGSMLGLYSNGKVAVGRLKSEIKISGMSFKADTDIAFYPTGEISKGEVLAGATPNNKNLTLPKDLIVNFDKDGYATVIVSATGQFNILGTSIASNAEVVFDKSADIYRLQRGTTSIPKIIASLPTSLDSFGRPKLIEPIIAPANSSFLLQVDNPVYAGGENHFDIWNISGRLTLNGQNLGYNPKVLIKNMVILRLQNYEAITINGVQIKAGTWLLLDNVGKIYVPQP